jgi:hypothetical protein
MTRCRNYRAPVFALFFKLKIESHREVEHILLPAHGDIFDDLQPTLLSALLSLRYYAVLGSRYEGVQT